MFTFTLHPYQTADVDRMIDAGRMLVAYEMGLGKTIMTIAAIEELIGDGKVNTAVVVCGATLKYQWANKIALATDVDTKTMLVDGEPIVIPTEEYCIIVEGTPTQRAAQYKRIRTERPDYVLIGYEQVVRDWAEVRKINPECVVIDEATAIKSFRAQRTRKLKRFIAPYRFALTGSPIENGKPEEVFSIMQWVDEEVLGRFDLFDRTYIVRNNYGGVKYYKNLNLFKSKLLPAICRKRQQDPDVSPFLPDVISDEIYVELDTKTRALYKYIAQDLLAQIKANVSSISGWDVVAHYRGENNSDNASQGVVSARIMALDMLAVHPQLLVYSAINYNNDETDSGSKYCHELYKKGLLDGLETSGKINDATQKIKDVLDSSPENKVIVFSFFTGAPAFLKERLSEYDSVVFHGGMDTAQRGGAIHRFQNDPNCRLFLSSHAGGYGVDLPAANYLFHLDVPWSAGAYDQFSSRHVRAGSAHHTVYIAPFLARKTLDVWKYLRVEYKKRVQEAFIDGARPLVVDEIKNDVGSLTDFLETVVLGG